MSLALLLLSAVRRYCMSLALLLLLSAATGVHHVRVGSHCATTDVGSLTSVTMDICLAKQGFPFGDTTLLQLTSHLGGGSAILRVGGSDQNSFFYDMASEKSEPFSAKSGGKCCSRRGSCHGCARDCTMPQKYWKSITTFANASGHRLMFGLVPEVDQATALVTHSAQNGLPVHAFTFGNEKDDASVIAGYQPLRKLLDDKSLFPAAAPLLAGPDVAMQRHDTIEAALAGAKPTGEANAFKVELARRVAIRALTQAAAGTPARIPALPASPFGIV